MAIGLAIVVAVIVMVVVVFVVKTSLNIYLKNGLQK